MSIKNNFDKSIGCLIGGAIGDSLGWPIEFSDIERIRKKYGKNGILGHIQTPAEITDDTQMTLYTAEGLMRMYIREKVEKKEPSYSVLLRSYHRWLSRQVGYSVNKHSRGTEYYKLTKKQFDIILDSGFLVHNKALNKMRSPGTTCTGALCKGKKYTFDKPYNSSMGCGAVMRAAPAGILYDSPIQSFIVGCNLAVLSHGNPIGYFSAGALASIINFTMKGIDLKNAISKTIQILERKYEIDTIPDEERQEYNNIINIKTRNVVNYIDRAVKLFEDGVKPTPENIERHLGSGWTGGEALSIAVYSSLVYENDFEKAILLAVNHSGDSDSTGAICGNILGSIYGESGIPDKLKNVELYKLIKLIGYDLIEIQNNPSKYRNRYPGW